MKSGDNTQSLVAETHFRVSSENGNYENSFFNTEADALREAREQSLKPDFKGVIFSVHRVSSGASDILIGEYIGGNWMPGVNLPETRF